MALSRRQPQAATPLEKTGPPCTMVFLSLQIFDVASKRKLAGYPIPGGDLDTKRRGICAPAFSPDGRTLGMLVQNERAVRLWPLDRLRSRLAALGLDRSEGDSPSRSGQRPTDR